VKGAEEGKGCHGLHLQGLGELGRVGKGALVGG